MKLAPERLAAHLKGTLAPVYLVTGDEPLQREEAADAIRAAARTQGYGDREVFVAERGFDWNALTIAGASLSLFATKRLLEIRLPTGKPGNQGGEVLAAFATDPAPDTVFLVISDARPERSAGWAAALERAGIHVPVWPVEPRQLPAWVMQRLRSRGFQPTEEAVAILAARVEGNLLAAAQEVEKLSLLRAPGPLDADAVTEAVADSARYDAFKLVDAALAGDVPRMVRVLQGLEAEGEEPVMVLGALVRQLRELAAISADIEAGQTPQRALAAVWERHRPLVQGALRRRGAGGWQQLLRRALQADGVLKGRTPGRAWDELLHLCTSLAGAG